MSEPKMKEKRDYLSKIDKLNKEFWIQIGFCALITFVLLLICTRSSFLYVYNNWDDANSYFSVGKGIFNGRVPYRDIFDQKGMYLYFLYGLGYLISHTTFIGVFLIEVILGTFYNLAVLNILQLYLKKTISFFLLPFIMAVTYSSFSFYWGGSAEEFMLPFLAWGLFFSIRYFKQNSHDIIPYHTVFVAGILAGVVANIKFNSLGLFFAFMMMIFIYEIICKKVKQAFLSCLIFLGGMFLATLPWIIYFLCNHAIFSWYEGYIYYNVFLYSNLNGEGPSLYNRIYEMCKLLYWLIIDNIQYFVWIILGFIGVIFSRKFRIIEKINLCILFGFLFLGVYIGGVVLPYYSLVLTVFTVLGFIIIGQALQWLMKDKEWNKYSCVLSLIFSFFIVYSLSMNKVFLSATEDDVFLTQFKEIVCETENPTLLNCGCLDAGLYTVCDIVPNCRWFQTQTLPIPLIKEEQNRYISEEMVDYVLVRGEKPTQLDEHYELVVKREQMIFDQKFEYELYKKRK